jgi:hypothetical protein
VGRLAALTFVLALALTGSAPAAAPQAVRLAGTTLEGKSLSLADFRGKPVIVNVWSSW